MSKKMLIRKEIASGELRAAIRSAIAYTQDLPDSRWYQDLLILSSDFETLFRQENTGQADAEDLRKQKNQLTAGLLGILDAMPDALPPGSSSEKPSGWQENTLKTCIAIMLMGGKILLLLWANFHRQTGGLEKEEFFSVMGYLMPIFVAYLSVILINYLRQRHQYFAQTKRLVPMGLVYLTFLLIPTYVCSFSWGISWRAQGEFTVQEMNQWLTLVESAMGVYVGIIVSELFQNTEEKN